ncbi:MAG: hypothetical protein J6M02_03550 [Clostridia bacterium]|nr:hypothetical protein [Clostridia bacterium]
MTMEAEFFWKIREVCPIGIKEKFCDSDYALCYRVLTEVIPAECEEVAMSLLTEIDRTYKGFLEYVSQFAVFEEEKIREVNEVNRLRMKETREMKKKAEERYNKLQRKHAEDIFADGEPIGITLESLTLAKDDCGKYAEFKELFASVLFYPSSFFITSARPNIRKKTLEKFESMFARYMSRLRSRSIEDYREAKAEYEAIRVEELEEQMCFCWQPEHYAALRLADGREVKVCKTE